MGLIFLCIFLSILLIPSDSLQIPSQSSHSQATETMDIHPVVPPRKMILPPNQVQAHGFSVPKPNNNHKENISASTGKPQPRERKRGELADMSSRFFTMDYAHVRRRRPVHNMSHRRP